MKRDHLNYLAAGAVVLAALALLLAVLYRITGRSGETDAYVVEYAHVAGLRYGTPVYFEGYRVGQIESVLPQHNGAQTLFKVSLSIEQGWPIPEDSVAEVATSGLLSDVFIVLSQGQSEQLLAPGATIRGQEATDVFATLNQLAARFDALAEGELEPLLVMVTERMDSITGNLDTATPQMLDEMQELLVQLNQAAEAMRQLFDPDNPERVGSILRNLDAMSGDAAQFAVELRAMRADMDTLLSGLNGLVGDNRPEVDAAVAELRTTVSRVSDRLDHIGFNLDQAGRHLNEFSRAIRHHPNRLIFGSEAATAEQQP